MTVGIQEHGSKDDPDYYKYHPNSDAARHTSFPRSGWNAPVSAEQTAAVRAYTAEHYANMNAMLRGKEMEIDGDPKQLQTYIEALNSAMRPSEQSLDLYRGTAYTAFEDVLPPSPRDNRDPESGGWTPAAVIAALQGHVGETFTDKGFLSTSLARGIGSYKSRELTMLMAAPEGTMSLNASEESSFGDREHEVILASGTKWRLDSVSKGRTGVEVHVTVLP